MDGGQQGHLESPLNQPRPPAPTSQKPQASSTAMWKPCRGQEMLGHPPTRGRHAFW